MRIHGAAARVGRNGGKERGIGDSEADFLAFHVAAGLHGAHLLVDAVQQRIAARFCPVCNRDAGEKQNRHRGPHGPAVLWAIRSFGQACR